MSNISAGTSTTTSLVQTGDLTGNLVLQSNAVSIATVTSTGLLVTGVNSASGNITGGNILTAGLMSSTGNAIHGNILTAGLMSSTGNAIHGNILTAGLMSSTGNILTAGAISSTGNITGNNMTAGNIVVVGGFTITAVGTKLVFSYGGANILSLNSTGNLIAANNVTAFGTP